MSLDLPAGVPADLQDLRAALQRMQRAVPSATTRVVGGATCASAVLQRAGSQAAALEELAVQAQALALAAAQAAAQDSGQRPALMALSAEAQSMAVRMAQAARDTRFRMRSLSGLLDDPAGQLSPVAE